MAKIRHLSGRLKRTRRWRRRILWTLLLLLIVGAGSGYYLTRPQRLGRFFADALRQATGTDVVIDQALLSYDGQIELEGVTLRDPEVGGAGGRIFTADRIIIQPKLWSLLRGNLHIRSLLFIRPTLYLTEKMDQDDGDFQLLGNVVLPKEVPSVLVRHGTLVFGQVISGQYHKRDQIKLEGQISESPDDPQTYGFVLRRQTDTSQAGPVLSGKFNLQRKSFFVELERFSFDRPERNFMPSTLRKWWDALEPKSSLPLVRVGYSPETNWRANIEFVDGELNLPVNLQDADNTAPLTDTSPMRMTEVSGRIDIQGGQVYLRNLRGLFKGVRYNISGTLDGLHPDAKFILEASTQIFTIPHDPKFVLGLPPEVVRQLGRFEPSGTFRAQATVRRPAQGQDIEYDGTLELINVRASYFRFPYPVSELTGKVRFTREQIEVLDISGKGPSGGTILVNGTIKPPGPKAQIDLTIQGTDIVLDQYLLAALKPKQQEIYGVILNLPAHQRLVERGLIRSAVVEAATGQLEAGADVPPLFDMGGTVDIQIQTHRPPGEKTQTVSTVIPKDARFVFKHWAYPLEASGGKIVISKYLTTIDDVTVRGPSGAYALVSGTIQRAGEGQPIIPHLVIRDGRLPADRLLMAAVAPPRDAWIKQLNLRGNLIVSGEIDGDEAGRNDFAVQCGFADNVSVTPFDGQYKFEALSGTAMLRPKSIHFNHVTARHGATTLSLDGEARWDELAPEYDLKFQAKNLHVEEKLLSLMPPTAEARQTLTALVEQYHPDGQADGYLQLSGKIDGQLDNYKVIVEPRSLDFDLSNERISIKQMSGKILIGPGLIELDQVAGAFPEGKFTAVGYLQHGQSHDASVSFTAQADRIGQATRAFLPKAVGNIIDQLDLAGGYDVVDGRWVYHPQSPQGPRMQFHCIVHLDGASATLGVPITDFQGTLQVSVEEHVEDQWPRIDLKLSADQLRAADRLIKPFAMQLVTEDQADQLELRDCYGEIYGGVLVGDGTMQLGPGGSYSFDLKIHEVDVESFLHPQTTEQDDAATGTLSASLLLEAPYARGELRRGRGAFRVRGAQLYDQPLPLALLQAINLSLPTSKSFDRASARYIIEGDAVIFDSLRIESPSIAIDGAGTMDWATLELNLNMVTRNPGAPDLGAFGQMLNVFKDELVTLHVSGTLNQPQAKLTPLSGISQSWHAVFGDTRARPTGAGEIGGRAEN